MTWLQSLMAINAILEMAIVRSLTGLGRIIYWSLVSKRMGERSDIRVMLSILVKHSNRIDTARYLSGTITRMAMNIKPKIKYNINCNMDADAEDLPLFLFLKLMGFLFSKITLVFKIILN